LREFALAEPVVTPQRAARCKICNCAGDEAIDGRTSPSTRPNIQPSVIDLDTIVTRSTSSSVITAQDKDQTRRTP
jgi:hypothetical protein